MAEKMNFTIRNFLITLTGGIVGSLLVGMLFWGFSIFSFGTPRSAVLVCGVIGSLVYSALRYRSLKDSVLFALAALLLNIIIFDKSAPFSFIIRDVVLNTGLWFSIFFYWLWLKKINDKYIFVRALGLAGISAVMLMISCLVLVLINVRIQNVTSHMVYPLLFFYMQCGIMTGLGMGLGFDAAEIFMGVEKRDKRQETGDKGMKEGHGTVDSRQGVESRTRD